MVGLRTDKNYTPKLTGLASLCDVLKYKVSKKDRPKDTIENLRKLAVGLGD